MAKTLKHKKVMVTAVIGIAGLLSVSSINAKDMEISKGSVIAATCYTCHGTFGDSTGDIPGITGMSGTRIKTLMMEYRDKKRASTVMGRHASGYTDEEIADVASYLGKLQKKGE